MDDKKALRKLVRSTPHKLRLGNEILREDLDIVLSALSRDGTAMKHANLSGILRGNRKIALTAVTNDGLGLEYVAQGLKGDQDVARAAVKQNPEALEFASSALRDDRELVVEAVTADGAVIRFASDRLRQDRELTMTAVRSDGMALYYAEPFRGDAAVVAEAAAQNGMALGAATSELRRSCGADKAFMMRAVTSNGLSLKFASVALRADHDLCLAAVTQTGFALEYAAPEVRGENKEVVLAACANSFGLAGKFASQTMQADPDVRFASQSEHARHRERAEEGGSIFA